ncbi:TetR/AcrR family transcriptional regulator [Actinomycetota bacterium]
MKSTTPSGGATSYDELLALHGRPVTARGERTRAALVAAARAVFERDGYLDSRLVDITAEAKCSTGTFYTYFDSKEEVLAAVLEEAQEDMLHPGTGRIEKSDDPVAVIHASNEAYFAAFARNAKLMALFDQIVLVDDRFREMRRKRNAAFVSRNAKAIRDLQRRGLADRDLDAEVASRALSSMVSRLAHSFHGDLDEADFPVEQLVETATRLWTNALGLTTPRLEAD